MGAEAKRIPEFLKVEKRDPKTGRVVRLQNYRLMAIRRDDYYEVPAHSGNWFKGVHNADNRTEKLSRVACDSLGLSKLPIKIAPMTLDQQIAAKKEELARLDQAIEARGIAPVVVAPTLIPVEDPAKTAENEALEARLEEARLKAEGSAPSVLKANPGSSFVDEAQEHRSDLKADKVVLGGEEKKK